MVTLAPSTSLASLTTVTRPLAVVRTARVLATTRDAAPVPIIHAPPTPNGEERRVPSAYTWTPVRTGDVRPERVARLLGVLNALTDFACAGGDAADGGPWTDARAMRDFDEVLSRFLEQTAARYDADRTGLVRARLEWRYPSVERRGVLAVGLADGSALVLSRGARAWRHITAHCARCGELAVYPVYAVDAAHAADVPCYCSTACRTGRVSPAARRRIQQTLNATWTRQRALMRSVGGSYAFYRPGWADKIADFSTVLACPGLDLAATDRRQATYNAALGDERLGVFVLADGSEFLQFASGTAVNTTTEWVHVPAADQPAALGGLERALEALADLERLAFPRQAAPNDAAPSDAAQTTADDLTPAAGAAPALA